MPVTFLEPTAERGIDLEPYELFIDTSGPITVGLISNAFPDGTEFMHKLESELAAIMPQATFRHYQKPNVAAVTDEQVDVISQECDAVLAAWGH